MPRTSMKFPSVHFWKPYEVNRISRKSQYYWLYLNLEICKDLKLWHINLIVAKDIEKLKRGFSNPEATAYN